LLSLLATPGGYLRLPTDSGVRPVDVAVVAMPVPRSAARPGHAQRTALGAASPTTPSSAVAPTAAQGASPAVEGPAAAPGGASEIADALRSSLFGCANQGAAWMSDAARDACRQRLAAGAASVPHLQGMAPEKLAYYAALAKAQQDWLDWRDPGHLPYIFCGAKFGQGHVREVVAPPHALKFGPCFLEPPQGMLSVTVDVPPPDHLSPDAVGPIAGQDPIRHQGQ